jgi:hypothetical protein
MKNAEIYTTWRGWQIPLDGLDADERRLLGRVRRRARTRPDWCDFGNWWVEELAAFYDARGLTRAQSRQTPLYRVAQDLCSRLGVAAGVVRPPDYRVELEELIEERYTNRREFCKATGLSEAMLSHVLAGRKDLSLPALSKALARIGYRLAIAPVAKRKRTG